MTTREPSTTPRAALVDPLALLLLQEGIVHPARLDEAKERVIHLGGTLDTALLELGLIEEPRLLELLARAYDLPSVGRRELAGIDKAVASLFPRRLAEEHAVVPIEVSGRRMTLAIAGPPDLAVLDRIAFTLSVVVQPAVTTQARVVATLSRMYGVAIPQRLAALLVRLDQVPADLVPAGAWQVRTSHSFAPDSLPSVPVLPTVDPPANDQTGWEIARDAVLARGAASAPRLSLQDGGSIEVRAIAERRAAEGGALDEAEEERRRARVLWSIDDAIAELVLADDRDAMIDVVLRFAYRRLGTVAAFIYARGRNVPGEVARTAGSFVGWDVIDPLLARRDIAGFSLPADRRHALGQVLEMKGPFLGPLRSEDPLVRLFGRRSRAVVLLPILVGDRFVGVLYGDCGTKPIPPSSLAELHMVVPRLGKGLGNLILRRKKEQRTASLINASPIAAVEIEEDIRVSAPAPPRTPPLIELDASERESLDAPTQLSSAERPPPMAWADGKADDEDVRLETGTWAVLNRDSAAAMPARTEPSSVPAVAAHEQSQRRRVAPSPGARSREALLLVTHQAWLAHEDALLDDLVGQLHHLAETQQGAAIAQVNAFGDRAMPSLARYFPGVLAVHPFGSVASRPEVHEISDCVACLAKLGADRAAPILVAELADDDRLHRWTAVWSLSAIHVPAALSRLAQRVFDAEPSIAALALEVLDAYRADPAFDKMLTQVRDLLRTGDAFERERAILAVTLLKDRAALPELVDLLDARPKGVAHEARAALMVITKRDFGTAKGKWRAWIAANDKTPRTRWLIDGLASKDEDIRRGAQQEINRLTGQFFGYHWDASRAERMRCLLAWEAWWSTQRDGAPGRWP